MLCLHGKNLVIDVAVLGTGGVHPQLQPPCHSHKNKIPVYLIWNGFYGAQCTSQPLGNRGTCIANIVLTFVCGCIRLCLEPKYALLLCAEFLPFHGVVKEWLGSNVPVNWTCCSTYASCKSYFRYTKSSKHWSVQNILQILWNKSTMDSVWWFP